MPSSGERSRPDDPVAVENFKALFDNARDLAYICDPQGNILYVSRVFRELTGHEVEEFTGKSFAPLFDEENLRIATEVFARTLQGESPEYELTFEKTGRICEYRNMPLRNGQGDIVGVQGIARDVTDRLQQEKERRLREFQELAREIVHSVSVGLAIYDSSGQSILYNDAIGAMIGITPEMFLDQTFHRDWEAYGLSPVFREVLESGKAQRHEIELRPAPDRILWLDLGFHRIYLEERPLLLLEAVDVTVRKSAEKTLHDAHQARLDFLARMNHELRTPLHSAMAAISLLKETGDRSLEESASGALRQAGTIVQNVLDFAKVESAATHLESRRFNLRVALDEIADVYRGLLKRQVDLQVRVAPDVPNHFHGDRVRFQDIIRNLLSNAAKHTTEGFVELSIDWLDREQWRLGGRVRDTGPGIPPDASETIFEAFTQVGPRHTRERGVGLGLSIVRSTVLLMDGEVRATNHPEGGAQFDFSLRMEPCREWALENRSGRHCSECDANAVRSAGSRTTGGSAGPLLLSGILVVEDVELNLSLMTRMLNVQGFQDIRPARDGAEALDQIETRLPDLLLLDLNLPDMHGLEVHREYKRRHPRGRTVIVTADATSDVLDSCEKAGVDHVLTKPMTLHDLKSCLAALA